MSSIEFWLAGVSISIFSVFGVFATCISIIVLQRIKTPFSYSLVGLSVFDTFFLVTSFFGYSLPVILHEGSKLHDEAYLHWMENVNDFGHAASIYFTVVIALQRCFALYFPLSCGVYITIRNTIYLWLGVFLVAILVQLLKLADYSEVTESMITDCGLNATEFFLERGAPDFRYIDYYVQLPYILVIICIPFAILTVLNALVVLKMRSSAKFREKNCHVSASGSKPKEFGGSTLILVAIVAVFLVCELGCVFSVVVTRNAFDCFYFEYQTELFAVDMFLLTVNSSVNFIIYFFCGTKFREVLKKMLRGLLRRNML